LKLTPTYSNSHALIIGINAYKTAPPLSYAVSDATAIASTLKDRFLFPTKNIHLLLESDATRAAVLDRFLSFACDGTDVNDRLVVFFAGHGHTVKSSRSEVGYLVPWDGDCGKLVTLIRWDELTRNADLIEANAHTLPYGRMLWQIGDHARSEAGINALSERYAVTTVKTGPHGGQSRRGCC
jgi:hypothetical protein